LLKPVTLQCVVNSVNAFLGQNPKGDILNHPSCFCPQCTRR